MNTFNKGLIAAALIATVATGASAATITAASINFGPTATDFTAGPFTVPSFNSFATGGVLTSVNYSLGTTYTTSVTALNKASTPQSETINVTGSVSLSSGNSAVNGLNVGVSFPPTTFTAVPPGATVSDGPTTASNTAAGSLAPATFVATGTTFTASTLTGQSTLGGGGNFTNNFNTSASSTAVFTYNYTPAVVPPTGVPPTGVPEPASMALIGAGVAGLGLLRRRKVA